MVISNYTHARLVQRPRVVRAHALRCCYLLHLTPHTPLRRTSYCALDPKRPNLPTPTTPRPPRRWAGHGLQGDWGQVFQMAYGAPATEPTDSRHMGARLLTFSCPFYQFL
jgi:hypothetical protein